MTDRLPAGRIPVGAAETTLAAKHRPVVDELRRMAGGIRPPYPSSSGFAFAFDEASTRDAADVSAVADRAGAGLDGVLDQPFDTPTGPEPGPVQPVEIGVELEVEEIGGVEDGELDAEGIAEVEETELPSTAALLSEPAGSAGRELAERACRALKKEWYREAERLFIEATKAAQTDPFPWFGAGLAARTRNKEQAAGYLLRAARLLGEEDPSGSAYAAIMAAELLESDGDAPRALRALDEFANQMAGRCPAISLHLARLEADSVERVRETIDADPMMEADVAALGIDLGHAAVLTRHASTKGEIERLGQAVMQLREVGGIPPNPVESPDRIDEPREGLPLAWIEMGLWQRVELCHLEIDEARERLEEREVARQDAEVEVAKAMEIARHDLLPRSTIPVFVLTMMVAIAAYLTYRIGRQLVADLPVLAIPISLLMWFVIVFLATVAVYWFVITLRPFRNYRAARAAKRILPKLRFLVAERRQDEILVAQTYDRASQHAEQVIDDTLGRRYVIVPRRPRFRSDDLPLVPARR